jgi:hypothetical protein
MEQPCTRFLLSRWGKNEWADAVFYMHELSEATLMSKGMSYEVAYWGPLQNTVLILEVFTLSTWYNSFLSYLTRVGLNFGTFLYHRGKETFPEMERNK